MHIIKSVAKSSGASHIYESLYVNMYRAYYFVERFRMNGSFSKAMNAVYLLCIVHVCVCVNVLERQLDRPLSQWGQEQWH